MRFINWVLKKLIQRERKRQIALGYTLEHDIEHLRQTGGAYFFWEIVDHYNWRHYIVVLALIQAYKEAIAADDELKKHEAIYSDPE